VIIGWSGDAVQLQADNPNIRFMPPETGVALWTDNMQVPVGAPHAYTAELMMNYVYDPAVQAPIAAYVNYICPVKGVKEILAKKDPELANNQLIFPSEKTLEEAFIFRQLKPDEETKLNEAFQHVIGA
jgi:spermidine/putrescine transport system substrate-binding protein